MSDRYLCKAKRTDNGEWVEGYYCKRKTGYYDNIGFHEEYKDCIIVLFSDGGITWVDVDPSTICQYTGLPDKDKTIMYENDIVRASGGVHGVIRFGKYGDMKTDYGFYIKWDKSQPYWRHDICYWQNEIKVIGSYIDNPELLGSDTVGTNQK